MFTNYRPINRRYRWLFINAKTAVILSGVTFYIVSLPAYFVYCTITCIFRVLLEKLSEVVMFKNEKRTNCEKPETRLFHDQCFNTKDVKFQYFWLTMLTIPIANDNRPMADCEKTSRLIGFPDVLPMIGSPLKIRTGVYPSYIHIILE